APALPPPPWPAQNLNQRGDETTPQPYTARHGVYLVEAAIANADLTLVTSRELYRLKSPFTDQIEILNNAADIAIFKKALDIDYPKPDVIKDIKGKIIGFIGNLDAIRVNYPLIQKTAVAHPEKTIVLVGPINNEIYREIGLDQMPNVIFTGGMPIEALPPYLRYFDCTIIPFHCNTLTKSIYPLKINEYLAAGKAVVATNFSPDIEGFKSQLFLANDEEEFVQLIDPAIAAHSETAIANRIATAKTNTWKARIEQFWDFVNPRLPQHVAPQRHEPLVSLVESTTKEIRS
ncbi:MAG: glycosyltransferase, partial [Bacteroidota bacterium]